MRWPFLALTLVLVGACTESERPLSPSVSVDGERLLGQYTSDGPVMEFLGVPFAEPPVGDLRWKAPRALQTKQEQRDATKFAAACMQTMRILEWYRDLAEVFGAPRSYYDDLEISEDCLYLNIWTPTPEEDAGLPVMVWIHGGSNKSGWSYEPNYRGQVLASQNVVVVTVTYRQGAFGFFSHPELAGEDAAANLGLWDLVAALQWVQNNIGNFGGDPQRVTLFGESAGGEMILALMFVEAAADLFHRAILQSAAAYGMSMSDLDSEQRRGAELAEAFGFSVEGSLEKLRQVPADELLDVYEANFGDYYHSPAIDGQLITESNWDSVQARRFGHHDLMIGTNDAEWLSYIDEDASVDDVILAAANHPRIGGDRAFEMVRDETDPRRAMDRLITADAYVCPSQNIAAQRSASGRDAWMYYFTRARDDMGGKTIGAYHGAELPYVFGVHDSYMSTNDLDRSLTATMQKYWVNFAATGNPNGDGLPEWPLFQRPDMQVQELGDVVRSIPAIEPEMCTSFEVWNANQR